MSAFFERNDLVDGWSFFEPKKREEGVIDLRKVEIFVQEKASKVGEKSSGRVAH